MSKGGGGGQQEVQEEIVKPHLGPMGEDWRNWDQSQIKRGLKGYGYAPKGFYNKKQGGLLQAATRSTEDAQFDFRSAMKNQWGDEKAMAFGEQSIAQAGGMLRDDIKQGILEEKAQDRGLARAKASDYAAGAYGAATQSASMYNRNMMQMRAYEQQYGTFNSNLMEGLGGMLGWGATGMQYGQMMAGK